MRKWSKNCWDSGPVVKAYCSPSSYTMAPKCCPEFDLTSLPIHRNKLLENNYLRTSLKTALFFNPIRVEIAAHSFRMIYLSILICCYITGHFLRRRFHQSSSHLSASAARTPVTGPRFAIYLTGRLTLVSFNSAPSSFSSPVPWGLSVWDILLFSIYRDVTWKMSPLQMTKIREFAQNCLYPSHHFEILYQDVNSAATHESFKPLTWFKRSLRARVWHLLKNPSNLIVKFPFLRKTYSVPYT